LRARKATDERAEREDYADLYKVQEKGAAKVLYLQKTAINSALCRVDVRWDINEMTQRKSASAASG